MQDNQSNTAAQQNEALDVNDVLEMDAQPLAIDIQEHSDDPLLDSLVIMTQLAHHPFSADALKAGLPLLQNRLTPELFPRAAKRAGFHSKVIKRKLDKIPAMVLPAVLILKQNQACVLLKLDTRAQKAVILQPVDGESVRVDICFDELQQQYSGYAFLLSREFDFDSRTAEHIKIDNDHWFWSTIWQSKSIYRDVIIASFFINLFVIATPLYIRTIYDRVIPNNAMETLWFLSAGVAVIYLFEFLLKTLRGHFIDIAGQKADIVMSSLIFEKVMAMRMEVRPESVGAFSDNIKSFEIVRNFLASATLAVFIDVPFFFLFLMVIYIFAGSMVYIPIFAMLVIVGYSILIRIPMKILMKKNFRGSLHKNATLVEGLSSVETLKAMGAEGHIQRKWEDSVSESAKYGQKIRILSQSVSNFSSTVSHFSTVAVMIIGISLVASHELTSGSLILCMMLTRRAISPMSKVAGLLASYQQVRVVYQSLDKIMQQPVERSDNQKFIHRPRLQGKIEFKQVSFRYPRQDTDAIKDISFVITPGEKVAFIGRIGSGKTTVEKMILGLYQPTKGQIRFDDVEVSQIDPADLRRNMGYIPQDITLFHGTVRDNICIRAPYISDQEILRVAEVAGVTNFTNRHPQGFDMPIKEGGEGLSGGQRQSIAIARALVLSPPILVMDEPTNSMDNHTERELTEKLVEEIRDRTMILITHRASLLKLVDRIIVLDAGEIVADGQKDQVLEALKQGRLKLKKN